MQVANVEKVMNDFELTLSWMFKCKRLFIKTIQNTT
jgi:hypothetical protein